MLAVVEKPICVNHPSSAKLSAARSLVYKIGSPTGSATTAIVRHFLRVLWRGCVAGGMLMRGYVCVSVRGNCVGVARYSYCTCTLLYA